MRPINVEITMGHNIGISASYYRPTEREVLEDYLKAVDLLTIDCLIRLLKKDFLLLLIDLIVRGPFDIMDALDVKSIWGQIQKELAKLKKYRLNHMKIAFSP